MFFWQQTNICVLPWFSLTNYALKHWPLLYDTIAMESIPIKLMFMLISSTFVCKFMPHFKEMWFNSPMYKLMNCGSNIEPCCTPYRGFCTMLSIAFVFHGKCSSFQDDCNPDNCFFFFVTPRIRLYFDE